MATSAEEKDLSFTPAYKLAEMIKSKKLSPVELMEGTLKRIREINPKINAYLTVVEEEAMQAAWKAEKELSARVEIGPLHGIPVSIKDMQLTEGIRTTMGSLVREDFVPDIEGTFIKRLKSAGAIIVGKTNTPEFGLSFSTENKLGDACRNPWNTERTSGGSSGGAAAGVAAGIAPMAQGGDGAGSTRVPACFCGLYGLKGSYGRVPKEPTTWGGFSHISHIDAMTRSVRDTALMMNVMSGPDGIDFTCIRTPPPDFLEALDTGLERLRIAWSPNLGYGVKVDDEVKSAIEAAVRVFEEMGHDVEEAAPATGEPFDTWEVLTSTRFHFPLGFVLDEHADKITDYVRRAMECARSLSGLAVAKGWIELEKIRATMLDLFEKYDLLLTPTTAVPAFPIGERPAIRGRGILEWDFCPFTCVFNLTGNPAASVPCGFTSDGLPIGLQIAGRKEDEVTVLRASAAFEEARPWLDKRPPLS
ncbi:MAG: amidase [Dehalococcoidales bacterium]